VARHADKLDINKDLHFQRSEWRFQRFGWWVLSAFVLAAALGLFGMGPLSHARTGDPGSSFWIEYERFTRVGAQTRIGVHGIAPAGAIHLRFNRAFLDAHRLERVTPEPASIEIGPSETEMRFDQQKSGGGTFSIFLDVEPLRAGRHAVSVTLGDGSGARFRQLAYF
jgi:hypothetical protein